MNIDITKKYTTRNGLPVRIYATDAGGARSVHGAVAQPGGDVWIQANWEADGHSFSGSEYDLIPAKAWRAWKEGESPVRIMIRKKGVTLVEAKRTRDCDLETLFLLYVHVHEDGTETPCGVCE